MLAELFQKKEKETFERDFYSLVVLSYYQPNQKKLNISEKKQGELITFMVLTFFLSQLIVAGQISEAAKDPEKNQIAPAPHFYIYCVRFFGSMALQLMMVPEINKGITLLRYVNTHAKSFGDGEYVCCLAAVLQITVCVMAIGLNTYLMATYKAVTLILKHFLSLKVAIWMPRLLLNAMGDTTITKVYDEKLTIEYGSKREKQLRWEDRSLFQKAMRVLYKMIRGFHLCVLYYFMPFAVMAVQNVLVEDAGL